jgi:hypothetical protein
MMLQQPILHTPRVVHVGAARLAMATGRAFFFPFPRFVSLAAILGFFNGGATDVSATGRSPTFGYTTGWTALSEAMAVAAT